MIGAIAGDIIGSKWEMKFRIPDNFELFPSGARYTDDTVLTCATAQTLLSNSNPTAEAFAANYRKFFQENQHRGYGSGFKLWAAADKDYRHVSTGNGCAMRVSPVGWAEDTLKGVTDTSLASAEYSHNTPEARDAVTTVATAIHLCRLNTLNNKQKKEYIKLLAEGAHYDLSLSPDELHAKHKASSCMAAVPLALRAFLEGTDWEGTVRIAVGFGGDTDTIASIAGAIAEPYYGGVPDAIAKETLSYLPPHLLKVVEEFREKYYLP